MISVVSPAPKTASQPVVGHPRVGCESSRIAAEREVQQRARWQRADRELCEAVVLQYSGRMLAVARRILRSDEDAADAVQDAFVSIFGSIERFRAQSQLYTWLHRIVVNACLMKLRSRKRRAPASLDSLLPAFDESGRHSIPVTCWPADHIERTETRTTIRTCIDRLPEDYRTVLILRDIEEFDTDATASALGISRTNVKTRLHRARQALRSLLEQELHVDA